MRLPLAKVYRAFPELDRFDDPTCERFVDAAERAAGWRASHGVRLFALVVGMLVGFAVVALFVLAFGEATRHGSLAARLPDWLAFTAVVVVAPLVGAVAGFKIRDIWLRAAIRRQIADTRCPKCRYSLLGLKLDSGTVTCPECGARHSLAAMGKTPADLLAR